MSKNKKRRRLHSRSIQRKRVSSAPKAETGFASSELYVQAVSKIYYREVNDIVRFVKFAESYAEKVK